MIVEALGLQCERPLRHAELLHGARRERGFYGGLYGTRVTAPVTGHACLRRERRWTRKTVICAGRALADGPEDEISGRHASLSATGSIVRVRRGNCPGAPYLSHGF